MPMRAAVFYPRSGNRSMHKIAAQALGSKGQLFGCKRRCNTEICSNMPVFTGFGHTWAAVSPHMPLWAAFATANPIRSSRIRHFGQRWADLRAKQAVRCKIARKTEHFCALRANMGRNLSKALQIHAKIPTFLPFPLYNMKKIVYNSVVYPRPFRKTETAHRIES